MKVKIEMGDKWKKKLETVSAYKVGMKVGVLEGATYEGGKSVAYVAYVNEYGAGNNPPRPFLKRTAEQSAEKWASGILSNVGGHILDYGRVKAAFKMAGMVAKGDVQQTIRDWPVADPRLNSPKTIARKRRRTERGAKGAKAMGNNPYKALIDTGTMIKAIGYEVVG
jgi:hypothetical protein